MAAEGPPAAFSFYYLGDNSYRFFLKYVITASGTFMLIYFETSLTIACAEMFSSLRDAGELGTSECSKSLIMIFGGVVIKAFLGYSSCFYFYGENYISSFLEGLLLFICITFGDSSPELKD